MAPRSAWRVETLSEDERQAHLVHRLRQPFRLQVELHPSASSTSAEPDLRVTPTLPCLASRAPPPPRTWRWCDVDGVDACAARTARVDQRLGAVHGILMARSRMASAKPVISSTVSRACAGRLRAQRPECEARRPSGGPARRGRWRVQGGAAEDVVQQLADQQFRHGRPPRASAPAGPSRVGALPQVTVLPMNSAFQRPVSSA